MKRIFTLFLTVILSISIFNASAQGDNCATAFQLTTNGTYTADGPSSGGGSTHGQTTNADWYYFTAPSTGEIEVNACVGTVDTRLWIYDGSCAALNPVADDDDGCTSGLSSIVTGLVVTSGTTYYFEWDDRWSQSGFQFDFTFTPYGTCPQPTNLNVSNITQTSASLSWTELGTATVWEIEYDITGFTQGTGNQITGVTNNPYSLGTLTVSTAYDYYVRAVCGPGDTSNWVGPYLFYTSCLTLTAPYTENFESAGAIPMCWTNDVGDDFDWSFAQNTPSPNTGPSGDHTSGSGYFAYTEASNPNNPNMQADLLSPWIDISTLSVPALHFWYNLNGQDMGELHVDIKNGTTWTNDIFQISGNLGDVWNDTYVDLSSYGDSVQIRFRGITDEWSSDMAIDDFSIEEMPTCPDPINLSVSATLANSAILAWTEVGSATNWNIEYGPTGYTLNYGTTVPATTNPYTLLGLNPSTTYDFYVQSDCGLGDTSQWIGPFSFTTACAISIAPYTENFENAGVIPNCWTNDIGDDINWSFGQTTPSFNTGPSGDHTTGTGYFAFTEASQPNYPSMQADMLSPWIDITPLTIPALDFWYHMYGADMGSLHIDINDGSGWTNDIFQIAGEQGDYWAQVYVSLSSYATDTIQLRFRGITGTFAYSDLAIDDVHIDEMPSCVPPSTLTTNYLTNTSVNIGWTEVGSATVWNIEYDTAGFTPGTGTVIYNVSNNPYNLSGLTPSTDYEFYVQSFCSVGDSSSWSGPKAFTTLMDPLTNPSVCEVDIEIPDGACVDIPIDVNSLIGNQLGLTIEVSDVNIIIQHEADMDLRLSLESPNGVIVELSTTNGGNDDDYGIIDGTCTQYTNFNMAGVDGLITAGTPPFVGSFIPEGDFADWNDNSDPNGIWILHVCDNWASDTGKFEFVEIVFNTLIPPADIIINEVDCDQANDTVEFIELYDGGVGNYPLTGYTVALYNGTTDQIYYSIDLDGYTTDSMGYFVLGNNAVSQASINFPDGLLQNGADAVALYFDDAANLPIGSSLTLVNLSDALTYATNDPVDIQLLALLNMGQPQINEDNLGDKDMHSCSRLPNGSGGTRNTATYEAAIPTPGESNQSIPYMVWDTIFTEAFVNNGSIENTVSVEVEETQYAVIGTLVENTHYTIANIPTGLTAVVNTINDTTAEITLNGNATAHLNIDDISNLSVSFLDAAFDQYAYYVQNKTKTDLIVDFFDNAPKTLVWNTDTFFENILNDGSIGNPINLELFTDTFALVGTLTETVHYNSSNIPAGLTMVITTLTDTTASIELTGNAISHYDSNNINDLEVTFLNAAFVGGSAANIANYSDTNLVVDYIDQASDSTDILAYSFVEQTGPATIDANNHTVDIEVANGTSLSYLVATYTLSGGATTTVFSSTQTSGVSNLDFTFPVTYNVLAEDSIATQDWVITVSIAAEIEEFENQFNLNIYPNPSSSHFNIEINSDKTNDFTIEIFNISGQLIYNRVFDNTAYINHQFNCDKLPKAVYYVKVGTNESIRVQKIIVQ
jgi:MAM domain, meprin/A5/mu/Secretion system C-terminal sorting domain/Fibronectin type III domain/Proprotein convertase P-domain